MKEKKQITKFAKYSVFNKISWDPAGEPESSYLYSLNFIYKY